MYNWTPEQQAIVDRILSGQQDYTFGPGSPNPTHEDLNTYVGGQYSPAGGFAVHGGVALAPKEYNMFSPEQRRYLGIMDKAPADQVGKVERYYSLPSPVSGGNFASQYQSGVGSNTAQMSTIGPSVPSASQYQFGAGSNPAQMSSMGDYASAQSRGNNIAAAGQLVGTLLQNLGKSQQQGSGMNPMALMQQRPSSLASLAPVPFPNLNLMNPYG